MSNKNFTEIKRTLTTAANLQVRENPGNKESRTITGSAILFNTPSAALYADADEEIREIIAPGAITKKFLDTCDIKMTMYHNRELILARSKKGRGTLKYNVTSAGVFFEFEAPKTATGAEALELVRRGDIAGCSFMFSTYYSDTDYVARSTERKNGKTLTTYTVKKVTGVYDFTLAADPAYPDTECQTNNREFVAHIQTQRGDDVARQIAEMRAAANMKI